MARQLLEVERILALASGTTASVRRQAEGVPLALPFGLAGEGIGDGQFEDNGVAVATLEDLLRLAIVTAV